ncbi:MAG: CPBP family intramembrane metalloprotease [Chloroflexi bacterium]|nr:CPBP family intramembrane metalloprotease [Chloroflexota bacterium]
MNLYLPGIVYAVLLLLVANLELRRRDGKRLTALLSVGLTQIDVLWASVGRLITALNPKDQPKYDKNSLVHRAASLLAIAYLIWQIWLLLLSRGGSEQNWFAPDISGILLNLAGSMMIFLSLSALGTGWGLRRDRAEALQRLGLRWPTVGDCLVGVALGLLLYIAATLAASVLLNGVTADQLGVRALFDAVKHSLPAALALAVLAGTGEEILFRGALQPVFGIVVTSLLFTMLHTHYGLSPALLILFAISVCFGLVRRRFSTTAAVICHATYNFAPFLLARMMAA